jgi:hypothetical protein
MCRFSPSLPNFSFSTPRKNIKRIHQTKRRKSDRSLQTKGFSVIPPIASKENSAVKQDPRENTWWVHKPSECETNALFGFAQKPSFEVPLNVPILLQSRSQSIFHIEIPFEVS